MSGPGWAQKGSGAPLRHTATSEAGFTPTGHPDGFVRQLPNPHRANDPYRTGGYDDYPGPPAPPAPVLEPFEVPTERWEKPQRKARAKKPVPVKPSPVEEPEHVGGHARVVCKCGADVAATPIPGPDVIVHTVDTCPACQ